VPIAENETKSILDLPLDEAEEARLEAEADAEIDTGKGVPHERVREWLLKLIRGEKVPPPEA
jgi:predicted transcriptional regulator